MQWDDAGVPANKDDSRNDAIRAEYAKWMALRQHPIFGQVLRYGDVRFIACDFDSRFLFERSLNGNRVIVLVNRSDIAIDLKGLKAGIADLREGAGKDTITPAWGVRAWGVDARGTVAPLATLGSVSK